MPSSVISHQDVTLYNFCLVTMSKLEANLVFVTNWRFQWLEGLICTCVSLKGFLGRDLVQNASIFSRLLVSGEQAVRILDVLLKSMV